MKYLKFVYIFDNLAMLDAIQYGKMALSRAVVVAQLVERSLPIPEVCGSNPVISKNLLMY